MDSVISRYLCLLLALAHSGCYFIGMGKYEDVLQRPSSEWSDDECLTIISSVMRHNLYDYTSPNVKLMATPYYPAVITAMNRKRQLEKALSEEQFRRNTDTAMKVQVGLTMDWTSNKVLDVTGKPFQNIIQMDSLLFLITVVNKNWPRYTPDISRIEQSILLANDGKKFIRPIYARGRRQSQLTREESMLVMFQLRKGDHHFLDASENMSLIVTGFEREIKLDFPLSMIR